MISFQVLQRLQGAWINEKFSPELLEPQIEIVDCLMEQIVSMEDHLLSLEKGSFAIALHKMEIQRVKFLVSPVVAFFLLESFYRSFPSTAEKNSANTVLSKYFGMSKTQMSKIRCNVELTKTSWIAESLSR